MVQSGATPVGIPLHHAVSVEERHADRSILNGIVMRPLTHSNPHLRAVILGEVGVLSSLLVPHSE